MSTFVVIYHYSPDEALQDEVRPLHLAQLRRHAEEGRVVASGPWGPGDSRGGLWLVRADDRATVEEMVATDPFTVRGVVATSEIREWVPLLGVQAPMLAGQEPAI